MTPGVPSRQGRKTYLWSWAIASSRSRSSFFMSSIVVCIHLSRSQWAQREVATVDVQLYYNTMYLCAWILSQGIYPQTAYKLYRAGNLPIPARKVGQLMLVGDLESQPSVPKSAVTYARVSSADQRGDLDRQVVRVLTQPPRVSVKPGAVHRSPSWLVSTEISTRRSADF